MPWAKIIRRDLKFHSFSCFHLERKVIFKKLDKEKNLRMYHIILHAVFVMLYVWPFSGSRKFIFFNVCINIHFIWLNCLPIKQWFIIAKSDVSREKMKSIGDSLYNGSILSKRTCAVSMQLFISECWFATSTNFFETVTKYLLRLRV